jgi:uncharacterized membrane protein YraQ (UPF0718 family)
VLGWGFVAGRIGLSFGIAVAVALVLGRGSAAHALLARRGDDGHSDGSYHDHDCDHDHGSGPALLRLLRHAGDELFEMGRYLVMGGLLAASSFRRRIVAGIVALTALLVLGAAVALQLQTRR